MQSQEKVVKPEIQKTIQFLEKLKRDLRMQGIHFENPNQIFLLRKKLLLWFARRNGELYRAKTAQTEKEEKDRKYSERIQQQENLYATFKDALLGLFTKTQTGNWQYQSERDKFLNISNPRYDINAVDDLITWHNNKPVMRTLTLEERLLANQGFEIKHRTDNYRLCEVVGTVEQKRLAFRAIENDLPNNCLGSVLDPKDPENKQRRTLYGEGYIKKATSTFLTLQSNEGRNMVAIELDIPSKRMLQIESNKHIQRGQVPNNAPYALDLIRLLCDMIKAKRLSGITGLDHLENIPALQGKVITRNGEILPKDEVPENEILFPTPIFDEIVEVEYPLESKTTPQDFLKSRDPKKKGLINKEYVEAGIYQWSKIFEEVKVETTNAPLTTLKSLELQKSANDTQIASRLGIQCQPDGSMTEVQEKENMRLGKIFTLKEIQTLMEMQMGFDKEGNIKEGYLKNDGYANIFYVKGSDNKLRSFYCDWDSGDREWGVVSAGFGVEWNDGPRVFSRN